MLRPSSLLPLALALGAVSAAVPAFDVPTFDYASLDAGTTPTRVLQALEAGGIVSLRGIPNYANVRERYLRAAVDCALAMEDAGHSEHVSTKHFEDGTRRLTLRATAGRELQDAVETPALAAQCPGYHSAYRDFSRTLENAVDSFSSALDGTPFRLSDGEKVLTPHRLLHEAVRLDHFHLYEASKSASAAPVETERELSLRLHEDHGMFIAMAAPAFFDVDASGRVVRRRLESDDSGLVIRRAEAEQSGGDDSLVRPVLKDDELVLMAGTGFKQWLEGTHEIPAVMHGMRMPSELVNEQRDTVIGHRRLRAWFGKMTLLPPYQRMLRGGVTFDKFTNMTTRHLQRSTDGVDDRELQTIGCAGGRRLVVSEGSCLYRVCKPRPEYADANIFPSCPNSCNYEYPSQKQVDRCNTKCECTDLSTDAGLCWMTCAKWLPEEQCALDRQYCQGTTMKCAGPGEPVTPQPTHDPAEMPPKITYHPITITPSPVPATPPPAPTTVAPEPTTSTPVPTPPKTLEPTTPTPTTETPKPTTTPEATTPKPSTTIPVTETPAPTTTPPRGQC